jgi:hypothetical protein
MFLGTTPVSSVSNGLYFLTTASQRHARYLYIKKNVEKVWGARYILGTRYVSKNTVTPFLLLETHQKHSKIVYEIQKSGNLESQKR